MLSSMHSVNEVEIGHSHHATGRPLTKPEIVHNYNKYRGLLTGVTKRLLIHVLEDAP